MEDQIKVTGHISIELRDSKGDLKETREIKNLVVSVGKNFLAAWLAAASESTPFMQFVGLGTGTNPVTSGDTTLQTEFVGGGYGRPTGTVSASGATLQNTVTFSAGNGTGAITEAGLFSASSSGTMFARQVFSVLNKLAGDTLQLTWQVTFS